MRVKLRGRRYETDVGPDETVLEAVRRLGLKPSFFCTRGHCGTCIVRVVAGEVTMRRNRALTPEEVEDGLALACQSVLCTPTVSVEFL